MVADSKNILGILAPDGDPPLAPPDHGVFLRFADDVDRVRALMELLDEPPEERRSRPEDLFADLSAALQVHVEVTENVIYPALASLEQTRDAVIEARTRQDAVKKALGDLHGVKPDSRPWQQNIGVLGRALRELLTVETQSLIPAGENVLSRPDMDRLAERYDTIKARAEAHLRHT